MTYNSVPEANNLRDRDGISFNSSNSKTSPTSDRQINAKSKVTSGTFALEGLTNAGITQSP